MVGRGSGGGRQMAEGGKQELENRKEEREKGKDRGPGLNPSQLNKKQTGFTG